MTAVLAASYPVAIGQAEITISAPVDTVYRYLADFPRHSEWVANVSKIERITPGPTGVGTTYRCQEGPPPVSLDTKLRMMFFFVSGLIGGSKSYSEATITDLEPNRRIAWSAGIPKGDGFFNRSEWEIVLEPVGGGTRLVQHFRYMPQTATAGRMVGAAGSDGLVASCGVSLVRLKTILERQPGG